MAFRSIIDRFRREEEQRQDALAVRAEAQAWRAWARLGDGVIGSQLFPIGRTYERMRVEEKDIRPQSFLQGLPAFVERQQLKAQRHTDRLIAQATPTPPPPLPPPEAFGPLPLAQPPQQSIFDLQRQAFGQPSAPIGPRSSLAATAQGFQPQTFAPADQQFLNALPFAQR